MLACAASSAMAADLSPAYKAPPAYRSAAVNWTGLYVGLNAGGGFGRFTDDVGDSVNANGFVGGGQIGYNWQIQQLVLGVEGDFQGTSQKATQTSTVLGIPVSASESLPWFGTARARVGYAFDSMMIYGTAGVGWTNVKISGTALGVTVSSETTKAGLAAGGGIEWMFAPRWSAKLEYIHLDSGNTTITFAGVPVTGRFRDNIVRAGVNYHF